MSIYKTLATKLALSPPITRTATNTPKRRITRKECQRLTPPNLYQRSPQTPAKSSSPRQENLCSFVSKEVHCTLQPVVPSIRIHFNQPGQNYNQPKDSISPISPRILEESEIDSPLRDDLLRRPQQKRNLRILGRGAFGHVFFGHLKGRKVAVKISRKNASNSVGEWNCLHLEHPHIIQILDIKENVTHRLTVMEYAGSKNLQQILVNPQTEIPLATKFRYSWQIASAVDYCHQQNILHLDIKPANIVVSSTGFCKLGDFGCSQRMTVGQRECILQGTVAYIAPEVLRGHNPSPAADIYSLSIVFWQILTRQNPFEGKDSHAVIYQVVSMNRRPPLPPTSDGELQPYIRLIQRCWDPCKNKRPAISEIMHDLRVHF